MNMLNITDNILNEFYDEKGKLRNIIWVKLIQKNVKHPYRHLKTLFYEEIRNYR